MANDSLNEISRLTSKILEYENEMINLQDKALQYEAIKIGSDSLNVLLAEAKADYEREHKELLECRGKLTAANEQLIHKDQEINKKEDICKLICCKLQAKDQECSSLKEINNRLWRQLDDCKREIQDLKIKRSNSSSATVDDIKAYKQQIKQCTDDFHFERQEKNDALAKVNMLQDQIRDLRDKINAQSSAPSAYQDFQLRSPGQDYRNQSQSMFNWTEGASTSMYGGYDEVDHAPRSLQIEPVNFRHQNSNSTMTKCYKCSTTFPATEFSKHLNQCLPSFLD